MPNCKEQILLFLPQKLQSIFLVEKQVFLILIVIVIVINILCQVTMRICPPPPLLPTLLTVERHNVIYHDWMGKVTRFYANEQHSGGNNHGSSDDEVNLFGDIPRPDVRSKHAQSKLASVPVPGGGAVGKTVVSLNVGPPLSDGGALNELGDIVTGVSADSSKSSTNNLLSSDAKWLDPIQHVDKMKTIHSTYSKKWCPGSLARTRTPGVATEFTDDKGEDGARSVRDKVYGVVLDQSPMDQDTWLLRFYNKKIFYMHIKLLSFEKSAATDLDFLSSEEVQRMKQARFDHMATEHETILKTILFLLTVKVPLQSSISVRSIVRRLKPFHPWLGKSSLREFVLNYRKKPSFNIDQDSSWLNTSSNNPAGIKDSAIVSSSKQSVVGNTSNTSTSVSSTIMNKEMVDIPHVSQVNVVSTNTASNSEKKRNRILPNSKYYQNKYNHSDSSDDEISPLTKKANKSSMFHKEYISNANKLGIKPRKLDFGKDNMKGK